MRLFLMSLLLLASSAAHAYVGPGLGLGVIGALLGAVLAVLLAIAGIVWYPLKRLLKKRNQMKGATQQTRASMHGNAQQNNVEKSNEP